MDFSQVKAITIPEGTVKQITDSQGHVLWKKGASQKTVTVNMAVSITSGGNDYPLNLIIPSISEITATISDFGSLVSYDNVYLHMSNSNTSTSLTAYIAYTDTRQKDPSSTFSLPGTAILTTSAVKSSNSPVATTIQNNNIIGNTYYQYHRYSTYPAGKYRCNYPQSSLRQSGSISIDITYIPS